MVGGCQGPPRVATIAGVVRAVERTDTQANRYVLDAGTVTVDVTGDDGLHPRGGGSPRVGDLLIVGSEGETTWYVVIAGSTTAPQGRCFAFWVTGVDRCDSIDTDIGVRFPKTANFGRGPDTDGNCDEQPHLFCVNDRGEIYAWV
jgi:hypothetical protein